MGLFAEYEVFSQATFQIVTQSTSFFFFFFTQHLFVICTCLVICPSFKVNLFERAIMMQCHSTQEWAEIDPEAGGTQAHHRTEKWTTTQSRSSKIFLKEHLFQNSRLRVIVHTKIIPSTKPWNCGTSIYRDLTAC